MNVTVEIATADGSEVEFREVAAKFNARIIEYRKNNRQIFGGEVALCEFDSKVRVMLFAQAFFGQPDVLQFIRWM